MAIEKPKAVKTFQYEQPIGPVKPIKQDGYTKEYVKYVQETLSELQKEKALKRKKVRQEKVTRARGEVSRIARGVGEKIKKIDITKEPKGYKQLQRGISKAFERKKVSSSELQKARAHELKMAKLRHKQRMEERKVRAQQLAQQAEQLAMQQDPRFTPDHSLDQFLGETTPEQPREEEYYGQNYQPEESRRFRFLNSVRLGRSKSAAYFGRHKLKPRNMLDYDNHINKPEEFRDKTKITLMQGTRSAERLQFMNAPNVINTKGNNNKPMKVSFLGGNPTKMKTFGKAKL